MNARTVWIVFAVLLAGFLLLAGRRAVAPGSADGGGGGAASACALPAERAGPGPHQTRVPAGVRPFRIGEFTMKPLAGFALEATVLGREDYHFGTEAKLSPTDLALGWERMADPDVYRALDIDQSGRWYRYRWEARGPPIPPGEIVRSSANMHMIPADERIAAALAQVRPEQTVRLRGWLVEARRGDGWTWRSSLSRSDTGDGSCEVVVICAIE